MLLRISCILLTGVGILVSRDWWCLGMRHASIGAGNRGTWNRYTLTANHRANGARECIGSASQTSG